MRGWNNPATYKAIFVLLGSLNKILEELLGKGEIRIYGGSLGWCEGIPSTLGDRSNFTPNWHRIFDKTHALINQCQLRLNCVEVLGGPVYVTHPVSVYNFSVAVRIQVLYRTILIRGVDKYCPPDLHCKISF